MNRALIITIVTLAAAMTSFGQGRSQPPTPYYDRGACPFECCSYRTWTVDKPTVVRTAMKDSAPVAFRLKKGEKVRGLTGTVITTRPGIATVVKPIEDSTWKIPAGERVYILTNQGEGYAALWYRGRVFSDEIYIPQLFRIEREAEAVWWVKVRNGRGKIGWSRQPENFGNKDECGG